MILWALAWLYFRFEFSIDWGGGSNLVIDFIPSLSLTVTPKDVYGFRMWSIGAHWLIFGIVFHYYYPSLFKINDVGEVVGKTVYPECTIQQID